MMQEIIIDFSKYASIADFHDDIAARAQFSSALRAQSGRAQRLHARNPSGSVSFTIFYGGSGIPHKQQGDNRKDPAGEKLNDQRMASAIRFLVD